MSKLVREFETTLDELVGAYINTQDFTNLVSRTEQILVQIQTRHSPETYLGLIKDYNNVLVSKGYTGRN